MYIFVSMKDKKQKVAVLSGIYKIECLRTGRVYIGQSINIVNRWKQHRYVLRAGKCENKLLQDDWNKYPESFVFSTIEELPNDKKILLNREREILHELVSQGQEVYNDMFIYESTIVTIKKDQVACIKAVVNVLNKGLITPEQLIDKLSQLEY